tara:strand:+ start:829 stop:2331 length:1503 start_codon:yes stop_codon:yes gene_type:complete
MAISGFGSTVSTTTGNSSGALSVSALNEILTKFYIPRMFEQIKVENPGYNFFKDMTSLVNWGPGGTATFPLRQRARRAVVGGTSGRLPKAGTPTYSQASFEYPIFRILINFMWDAQQRAGHERYVKNLIDQSMTDAKTEFLRRQNIYLYGGSRTRLADGGLTHDTDGTHAYGSSCIVGRLTELSQTGDNDSLKIAHPWCKGDRDEDSPKAHGAMWLQPNDYIMIVGSVGGVDRYQLMKISTIDRSTYSDGFATVVTTGTTSVNFPVGSPVYLASPSDTDVATHATTPGSRSGATTFSDDLWELSDYASEYFGMYNFLGDSEVFGKTRSNSDYWDSKVNHNSGTNRALSYELIDKLLLEMNQQYFVKPNLAIMNPGMWHEFLSLAEANHAFFNQKTVPIGHKPGTDPNYITANATLGQGNIQILVDHHCPHEQITVCDKGEMGYATAHAMGEATEDGGFLRHSSSNYDDWHGWLRWAGQFITFSPTAIGQLNDITQDIVAL